MASSRRRVAAATFVLAVVATGCDVLLGLGHFKDVPCALDCPDVTTVDALAETSAPETSLPEAGDAAADALDAADAVVDVQAMDAMDAIPPAEAASPHEVWAHWPMPNPDAPIAPDSSTLLPNPMTYDASVDGSVLDIVTGLTWEVASQMASDYASASSQCQALGMRVPTRIELVSLVDFTTSPAINKVAFPGTPIMPFWTSSVVWADAGPDAAALHWSVSFSDGLVTAIPASLVRCVSGGTP
jgi:hypothetical protein